MSINLVRSGHNAPWAVSLHLGDAKYTIYTFFMILVISMVSHWLVKLDRKLKIKENLASLAKFVINRLIRCKASISNVLNRLIQFCIKNQKGNAFVVISSFQIRSIDLFCQFRYCHVWPYKCSVTRFGKILLLGCNFKSLQQFLDAFSIFDNILDLLWQILNTIGEIFIVVKGQKLKN